MAKKLYVEVGGKTRKAKKGYVSVNDKARKIKKAYVGVNGKARAFWSGGELRYYGRATALSEARSELAAATVGNYALFGGGDNGSSYENPPVVDAYDKNLTRIKAASLPTGGKSLAESVGHYAMFVSDASRFNDHCTAYDGSLTATSTGYSHTYSMATSKAISSVGNYVLVAGGAEKTKIVNTVRTINDSLTIGSATSLRQAKRYIAGGKVGGYALFAGGDIFGILNTEQKDVDAYNASLTRSSVSELSKSYRSTTTATVGSYALFHVGSGAVDVYNASLTKSTTTIRTDAIGMAATSFENYAIFAGETAVVAFDESLTCTGIEALSSKRYSGATTAIGNYALFAGGKTLGGKHLNAVDVYTID